MAEISLDLAAGAAQLLVEKQVVTSARAPQRMTFALARLSPWDRAAPGRGSSRSRSCSSGPLMS